ncbi:MAG: hypothetical protein EOO46_13310 [Flavobacterium sp.]|nr:MAG: hypothetical protein EOO46_13310 [Flavobacterium sp.]
MGFFDFLKPNSNKRFVTESEFRRNQSKQIKMAPQTLSQLRKLGVSEERRLKLEYFLYADKSENASALAAELEKLNYSVEFGKSAGDEKLFVITGWSTPLSMNAVAAEKWTSDMCELGFKYDCEFDGWGTTPDQE